MKKLQSRDEWLNEGHTYDNEIENARMMQGSASELVQWAERKIAESKPENFKEGVIKPVQEKLNFIIQHAKSGDPYAPYDKPFFITTNNPDKVVSKMNKLGIRGFTNDLGDGEFEIGVETYDPKAMGFPGKANKLVNIDGAALQQLLDILDQRRDGIQSFGWHSMNESVNEGAQYKDLYKEAKKLFKGKVKGNSKAFSIPYEYGIVNIYDGRNGKADV